jgi:hypothetical protein
VAQWPEHRRKPGAGVVRMWPAVTRRNAAAGRRAAHVQDSDEHRPGAASGSALASLRSIASSHACIRKRDTAVTADARPASPCRCGRWLPLASHRAREAAASTRDAVLALALALAYRCFLSWPTMEVRGLNARRTTRPIERSRITTVTVAMALLIGLVFVQGWWRHIEPLRPVAHYHVAPPSDGADAGDTLPGIARSGRDCIAASPCGSHVAHGRSAMHAAVSRSMLTPGFQQAMAAVASADHSQTASASAHTRAHHRDSNASARRHAHGHVQSQQHRDARSSCAHGRHRAQHAHHMPASPAHDAGHLHEPPATEVVLADPRIDAVASVARAPVLVPSTAAEPPTHRHDLARDHRHSPHDRGVVILPGRINVAALESLASAFEPGWSLAPIPFAAVEMHQPGPQHRAVRPAAPRWHGEAPDRPPSPHASV